MNTKAAITFHSEERDPLFGTVSVSGLPADLLQLLVDQKQASILLQHLFRITVEGTSGHHDILPPVGGVFHLLPTGFYFVPFFPFDPGLSYAVFLTCSSPGLEPAETMRFRFTWPPLPSRSPAVVASVYPSDDTLPENLLRFYVHFSTPMQRGFAAASIALFDRHGKPVEDALYRPPLELWDREMEVLTVLLDPGRLKRGVGPHRALGPPLRSGEEYKLRIQRGMRASHGQLLQCDFEKTFYVSEPWRTPILVTEWRVTTPAAGTREPLVLDFPRVMDHAIALNSITVWKSEREMIAGSVQLDEDERSWTFAAAAPWEAGYYAVQVSPDLEDVCGNSLTGAFDRPIYTGAISPSAAPETVLRFQVV